MLLIRLRHSARVAAALAIVMPVLVLAHHSRSNFDLDTVLEFEGVISEYSWRNPHTFATLTVTDDSGEKTELLLELNSVSVLTRQGWARDTLKVGDKVTVFANPDQDSSKNLYYSNYFLMPDGSVMTSAPGSGPGAAPRGGRGRQQQTESTARSEDFSGIWRAEGGRFAEQGGNTSGPNAMSLGGQVKAVGLPLTAKGQAELDTWDVEDNPWFRCEAKTAPWAFSGVGGHKIIRESADKLIIRHEILDVERIVYMNLTEHPAATERTHQGHSIGHFEGDTLVVDTTLFTAAQWGIGSGVSSSTEKHLVARYTLLDDGRRLQYEYVLEDPVYLAKPVSLSQTFSLNPNYAWQDEYGCDPEASSRHIVD
jgi:hypothetical protein